MTSTARLGATALLGLALALAACSPAAARPAPTASAAVSAVAFQGTIQAAAGALAADGFSCDPDLASPRPSHGTALDMVYTKACRKPAAGGQGTFLVLYGLRTDGSIVGIDILTDQAGTAGASSPAVENALALVFPATAAAVVQKVIGDTMASDGSAVQVTATVQVRNLTHRSPNGALNVAVWGPEVVAAAASMGR